MLDKKVFTAIGQYIKKYILNPVVVQAELRGKKVIIGRFKSGASVFDFELTPKGVSYHPTSLVSRNDALFGQPTAQYKCTAGKSYQCGKICLTVHNHCRKNENNEADIRRLASIFAYANGKNADQNKVKTLTKKALSAVQSGLEDRAIRLANKVNQQTSRNQIAKAKKEQRSKTKIELPENHVVSGSSRYSPQAIADALGSITSEGAKERIKAFTDLIAKQNLQAVFNDGSISDVALARQVDYRSPAMINLDGKLKDYKTKTEELSQAGQDAIVAKRKESVVIAEKSLAKDFTAIRQGAGGYTSSSYNHIVISATKNDRPFKVTPEDIAKNLDRIYSGANSPLGVAKVNTTSSAPALDKNYDTRDLMVYLHEMGHQIDYLAKHSTGVFKERKVPAKSLTKYSTATSGEWFAEHFAAWMLDPKRYAKFDPEGAKFVESIFNQARSATKRIK